MRYSPRNIEIAFGHAGLTHYGGVLFVGEFISNAAMAPLPNSAFALSAAQPRLPAFPNDSVLGLPDH